MEALLAGDDPRLAALRKQYATATVRDRQFSGVGFFTDFQVQASIEKTTPSNFELGDHFLLELEGLQHGAGVVLFVRNGVIETLEGYCFGETWPAEPKLRLILRPEENSGASSA